MNNVVDLLEMSSKIEEEVKQKIKGCIIRPSVAVIDIGNFDISDKFIKQKEEACNNVGIYFRYHKFEDDTPELTIINKIKELNNDDYVNGISVQLPIPEKYNIKRIINTIINSKDVEGLTDINIGRLISGRKSIQPCAVQAIMEIINEQQINLEQKEVVIIGKGKLVGRPLINVLLNEGATVTVCHSRTSDLIKHTKDADIIITATGSENLITGDMIKKGSVVISAGCSIKDDKISDDIDLDSVASKASLVVPSLNGMDKLIVAMFLKNILFCYTSKK